MKKRFYIVAGSICAVLCLILLLAYVQSGRRGGTEEQAAAAIQQAAGEQLPPNFTALQEVNHDIYAWLDIPGSHISTPVLQCQEDQDFYLNHGLDRNNSPDGALFTEPAYNGMEFDDLVTVIYGHRAESGAMFGGLQDLYSDSAQFSSCDQITIYLPDHTLCFQVFAAVPFDDRHLLYQYDFSDPNVYSAFFNAIKSIRELGAHLNVEAFPVYPDQVLILSTCLEGDETSRYLVMSKLLEKP